MLGIVFCMYMYYIVRYKAKHWGQRHKGTNPNEEIQASDLRDLRSKAFVKYWVSCSPFAYP